tara:strand:- start:208 stop:780 length:573 start_codon:yes stop_codon:yes gene_type:complete
MQLKLKGGSMKKLTGKQQKELDNHVQLLLEQKDYLWHEPTTNDLIMITNKLLDYDRWFLARGATKAYWKFVADVYTGIEFPYLQRQDLWRVIMSQPKAEQVMTTKERHYFEKLPNEFEVYRGGICDQSLSWTLDKKIAEFFSNRTGKFEEVKKTFLPSHIFTKTVNKENCIGYLDRGKEQEILIKYWEVT